MLGQRRVADRAFVHECQVREIEQVVDDELPIGFDVQVGRLGAPARVVEPMEVGDVVRIGEGGITHPDPQPVIALHHRIGLHLRRRGNVILPRDPHTAAIRPEPKPVIMALQRVADELAHREREMPMRATVLECDSLAVLGAEEHHRLAQDHARERVAADLGVGGGDIPMVSQEHGDLPDGASFGRMTGSARSRRAGSCQVPRPLAGLEAY